MRSSYHIGSSQHLTAPCKHEYVFSMNRIIRIESSGHFSESASGHSDKFMSLSVIFHCTCCRPQRCPVRCFRFNSPQNTQLALNINITAVPVYLPFARYCCRVAKIQVFSTNFSNLKTDIIYWTHRTFDNTITVWRSLFGHYTKSD